MKMIDAPEVASRETSARASATKCVVCLVLWFGIPTSFIADRIERWWRSALLNQWFVRGGAKHFKMLQ